MPAAATVDAVDRSVARLRFGMGYDNPDYSNEDFRSLLAALQRYAEMGLDQWAAWQLPTRFGEVFVTISRSPRPGETAGMFDPVAPDMPLHGDG